MHLKQVFGKFVRYEQQGGVGYAYVDFFPGDSDIGVINAVYVPPEYRGQGIGSAQHLERLELMREMGMYYALCTARNDNDRENHILERSGWEPLKRMEYVTLWFKDLRAGMEDISNVEPE